MRLEEAYQLLIGGHRLAAQDPSLGLVDDPFNQRLVMADGGLPEFDGWARGRRQLLCRLLKMAQGGARDPEQLAIGLDPLETAAGILDRPGPLLRRAAVIMPWVALPKASAA